MSKWADLKTRTISAVVMVAGFIAITEAGLIPFSIMMVAAWAILLKEWWGLLHYMSSSRRLASMFSGVFYITLGIASFWYLYYLEDKVNFELRLVYALILQVAMIDIGGYFTGKLFGKHKLAPDISPGKTWEGFAGSIVFSMASAYALTFVYHLHRLDLFVLIGAPILAAVALWGDLAESKMKRMAGVKDSGTLIPGHGGLFDRVDGLLACAIAMALPLFLFMLLVMLIAGADGGGGYAPH